MNVKSLIQEELGEGMTEQELASSIGVSLQTLENILADKFPEDPASWEPFARYFRMDVDKLRWVDTLNHDIESIREHRSFRCW